MSLYYEDKINDKNVEIARLKEELRKHDWLPIPIAPKDKFIYLSRRVNSSVIWITIGRWIEHPLQSRPVAKSTGFKEYIFKGWCAPSLKIRKSLDYEFVEVSINMLKDTTHWKHLYGNSN